MPLLPGIKLEEFGLLDEWTGGMTCAEVRMVNVCRTVAWTGKVSFYMLTVVKVIHACMLLLHLGFLYYYPSRKCLIDFYLP